MAAGWPDIVTNLRPTDGGRRDVFITCHSVIPGRADCENEQSCDAGCKAVHEADLRHWGCIASSATSGHWKDGELSILYDKRRTVQSQSVSSIPTLARVFYDLLGNLFPAVMSQDSPRPRKRRRVQEYNTLPSTPDSQTNTPSSRATGDVLDEGQSADADWRVITHGPTVGEDPNATTTQHEPESKENPSLCQTELACFGMVSTVHLIRKRRTGGSDDC